MASGTPASFAVRRWERGDRFEDLLALVHGAFGAVAIDPPSSALKETVHDMAARAAGQTIFIASADACLIGCIFCVAQGTDCYIGRLAVAPPWRRRGVASALLTAAAEEAGRRSMQRLTLRVRIALCDNVRFFRRRGFAIVGEGRHPGFAHPTFYEMAVTLAAVGAAAGAP